MIDFKELPEDGTAFEQLVRELLFATDMSPRWTGKGADQGRDILLVETATGPIGSFQRTWLIQCKHTAHSGKSVGRNDIGSVIDDCRQVSANGYLLVCSTQPSAGLITKLKEIENQPTNGLITKYWDGVFLEKMLSEPRCFALGHLFFPKSFEKTPWRLYNAGSPNVWTAHYKAYFLHLSSRISGRYPNLKLSEAAIGLLERIEPKAANEFVRPRAIYHDDKNGVTTVFVDYLFPIHKNPSLLPKDFNRILHDGDGIECDEAGLWLTHWDVQTKQIIPGSDHFDLDHYDFYNPYIGNYHIGVFRGAGLSDLVSYGNTWPSYDASLP